MAEGKLPFGEGASINRPPLFSGVNYQFWKIRMKIFIESLDRGIWDEIVNGPYIPKTVIDGTTVASLGLSGVQKKAGELSLTA